jgi:hypothetical protein
VVRPLDAVELDARVPHRRVSRRITTSNSVSTILNRPASTLGAVKYCLTSCSLKA